MGYPAPGCLSGATTLGDLVELAPVPSSFQRKGPRINLGAGAVLTLDAARKRMSGYPHEKFKIFRGGGMEGWSI